LKLKCTNWSYPTRDPLEPQTLMSPQILQRMLLTYLILNSAYKWLGFSLPVELLFLRLSHPCLQSQSAINSPKFLITTTLARKIVRSLLDHLKPNRATHLTMQEESPYSLSSASCLGKEIRSLVFISSSGKEKIERVTDEQGSIALTTPISWSFFLNFRNSSL